MSESITKGRTDTKRKTARPPLYRVMLLNDDYTPREFVVLVLKSVFRLTEDEAGVRMMTAHQKGVSVVAVYTSEVAEAKATEAVDLARDAGFPLMFVTEPED
jgi:ATP-dependent Clp protease adaptor protein ClpS